MKKRFCVIIGLAVIVGLLFIGKNIITKFIVEKGVRAATGLSLKIKKFDLGLITTRVGIEDLNLFNPKGFTDRVMFHAPEILVDYNLRAIIKGKIHLEDVRLHFDQFVIVKDKQGQTNLEVLKPKEEKRQEPQRKKKEEKDVQKKKISKIQIDHLVLKVGKVTYKDYSKGGAPIVKEYNVDISEEINDVTDVKTLLRIIATKAIAKTALASLIDFNVDIVKDAIGIPGQAVDVLKEKIKLPFGKKE